MIVKEKETLLLKVQVAGNPKRSFNYSHFFLKDLSGSQVAQQNSACFNSNAAKLSTILIQANYRLFFFRDSRSTSPVTIINMDFFPQAK